VVTFYIDGVGGCEGLRDRGQKLEVRLQRLKPKVPAVPLTM
jgi:hypothetical protein